MKNTTLKHWLLEDEEKSGDQQKDSVSENQITYLVPEVVKVILLPQGSFYFNFQMLTRAVLFVAIVQKHI